MDDTLTDIYGDLDEIDFAEKCAKLQEENEVHIKNIESLTNEVNVLNKKLKEFQVNQEKITRNISELFKTAKAELARKDRMIAELRKQVDDILFKRNDQGGQKKRPMQEEIGEQKLVENKKGRFEKNQDKIREKSHEKQDFYNNKRDYRERDKPTHYSNSNYDRKYDHKDDYRGSKYTKYTERRSQDKRYIDNRLINDKKFGPSRHDVYHNSKDVKDGKENKVDMNMKNFDKIEGDKKVSSIDFEAYVHIEKAVIKNNDVKVESIEIEEGEIEENEEVVVKKVENKSKKRSGKTESVPKKDKVEKGKIEKGKIEKGKIEKGKIEKAKIEKGKIEKEKFIKEEILNEGILNENILNEGILKQEIIKKEILNEEIIKKENIKEELNDNENQNFNIDENKLTFKEENITETLNSSAQELQNAINSIKNQSSEESFNNETMDEETLQSIVDPNDSSIITQGNCIKLTNNCNKSFRSRRKRVVITVTD